MDASLTQGSRFRAALQAEQPLQIVGAVNAYCAMMAEQVGYRALYLSGSGVAAASYGLPDLGITCLEDVLVDLRRIVSATDLPVLVDIDTGFGSELNIAHTIRQMIAAGAAAVHIEDQVEQKRCGHRPGKQLVSAHEMVQRLSAAVNAKSDSDLMIIARTDAVAVEGVSAAVARAEAYIAAGAEAIFAEALTDLDQYHDFCQAVDVPVLANITEFGVTPLFTLEELKQAGLSMVLYPLSAFRAVNQAALAVYQTIRDCGTQADVLHTMQDRETLYKFLDYYRYEQQADALQDHSDEQDQ